MNLNSITQSIMSGINFLQNLGASTNLPDIDLPGELRRIFQMLSKFLETLLRFIPVLPPFDVRAQLLLTCIGIPLILDIIFVWYVAPLLNTVFHIVDLAAIACSVMLAAQSVIQNKWTVGSTTVVILGALYLVLRIIIVRCGKRKKEFNLKEMTQKICNYFMAAVIPGVVTDGIRDDVNEVVRDFSRTVEIVVEAPRGWGALIAPVVSGALIVVSLWTIDIIDLGHCPPVMKTFFPYIGFTFAGLILISYCMQWTHCGRTAILALKRFTKRWGLRLLMLFLDMLYIPILTNLVTMCTPSKVGCELGSYLSYERVPGFVDPDPLWEFVNHSVQCVPCDAILRDRSEACKVACSGIKEWRVSEAPNLLFVDDVLKVAGGFIIYCIGAVMIGIPLLWAYITYRNRKFVCMVNVYGKDVKSKWLAIVHRMETTGIFLFQYYKEDSSYWSVFIFFSKFVVMVITTIAGRVQPLVIIALPVWYFIVVLVYTNKMPYIYKSNNVLDIILYIINCMFSIIPVFAKFGYQVREDAFLPLSYVIVAIPVISIFVMICLKHRVFDPNDPTISASDKRKQKTFKGDNSEQEAVKKRRELSRRKMARKSMTVDDLSEDDNAVTNTQRAGVASKGDRVRRRKRSARRMANIFEAGDFETKKMIKFANEIRNDVGEDAGEPVRIPAGHMDPIDVMKKVEVGAGCPTEAFDVGNILITKRTAHMYRVLDTVIDGRTISLLTKVLKIAMMFGAAAFGWYVGGLRGTSRIRTQLNCG